MLIKTKLLLINSLVLSVIDQERQQKREKRTNCKKIKFSMYAYIYKCNHIWECIKSLSSVHAQELIHSLFATIICKTDIQSISTYTDTCKVDKTMLVLVYL